MAMSFNPPERSAERERENERFWTFVESSLVYLGDDRTDAAYLPVSLRTRRREQGIQTWRDLFDRGLVSADEVVAAASFRAKSGDEILRAKETNR